MRLLIAAFVFVSLGAAVAAPAPAPPPQVLSCVPIAEADRQDAKNVIAQHLKVYELSAAEIASFKAFMDDELTDEVDVVTLFVFPDGHSEYVIGSRSRDLKCGSPMFVLSAKETSYLLKVIRGTGV